MSNLKKWGDIYEIYRGTQRASIIKMLYINKPISESWPYYSAVVLYFSVSLVVYLFGKNFYLSLPFIMLTALIIYIWLEFRVEMQFREHYLKNNLKSHPFFLRTKYLSYILFVEFLNANKVINKNDVATLVEWEDVRTKRLNAFDFFKSSGVLFLLTVFSSVFIEYLKLEKMITSECLLISSLLIFIFLWSTWVISDTLKSHKKKNIEVCRFLLWWKLDNET